MAGSLTSPKAPAASLFLALAVALLCVSNAALAQTSSTAREWYLRSERGSQFIWRRRNDMPAPRSDFALAHDTVNTRVYITGGCVQNCSVLASSVWIYYPTTDYYVVSKSMSMPRYRHGSAILSNTLVIFGGLTTGDATANVTEEIDLTTNKSTIYKGGPVNQISDFTYFVYNSNLYVAGGYNSNYDPLSAIYVYKGSNVWSKIGDLIEARGDAFATVVLNKAYIVGGWTSANDWAAPLGTMESFTLQTTSVVSETDAKDILAPPRGDATFCAIRARLFVFGGENPSNTPIDQVNVLSLDYRSPESADWHYAGELPTERFRFGCSSLTSNSIHLFGGQSYEGTGSNVAPSARVDEFVEVRMFENLEQLLPTNAFISGAYSVAPWMWTAAHYTGIMARSPVRVQYRVMETATAQTEFAVTLPRDNVYIGDFPLTKANYNSISNNGHAIVQIPLAMSAVRFVYSLTNNPVVKLDACTLSRIFSGVSMMWSDVATDLPKVAVTALRQPVDSSLSITLVAYLKKACPSEFSQQGFNALTELASKSPDLTINGAIMYTFKTHFVPGVTYAQARILNPAGNYSHPDAADLRESLPANLNSVVVDLSSLDFLNANTVKAYPVVVTTFAYVRQDQTGDAQTGPLVKAFLRFLLSDQGQAQAASLGHTVLTPYWLGVAKAGIEQIKISADATEYVIDQPSPEPDYSLQSSREDLVLYNQAVATATLTKIETVLNQVQQNTLSANQNTNDATLAYNVAVAGLIIALLAFLLAVYIVCTPRHLAPAHDMNAGAAGRVPSRAAKYSNNHPPVGTGIGDEHIQVV